MTSWDAITVVAIAGAADATSDAAAYADTCGPTDATAAGDTSDAHHHLLMLLYGAVISSSGTQCHTEAANNDAMITYDQLVISCDELVITGHLVCPLIVHPCPAIMIPSLFYPAIYEGQSLGRGS